MQFLQKCILHEFRTADGNTADILFSANNSANISFPFDPQTEDILDDCAQKSSSEESLRQLIENRAGDIHAHCKKLYGQSYDFNIEQILIGQKIKILEPGSINLSGFTATLSHSHPGSIGSEFSMHQHDLEIRMRFKGAHDHAKATLNHTAQNILDRTVQDFFSREHPETSMEKMGEALFQRIDSLSFPPGCKLQALESTVQYYRNIGDHPGHTATFITERAPGIAA